MAIKNCKKIIIERRKKTVRIVMASTSFSGVMAVVLSREKELRAQHC